MQHGPYMRERKNFKIGKFWQSYKKKRDCLVHFIRRLAACWTGAPEMVSFNHSKDMMRDQK